MNPIIGATVAPTTVHDRPPMATPPPPERIGGEDNDNVITSQELGKTL